jgi:hypothetical protein
VVVAGTACGFTARHCFFGMSDYSPAAVETRVPGQIFENRGDSTTAAEVTEVMQDYTGVLHAEGAFAGLSWPDARAVAAAICFDACNRDDAADFIRNRARNVLGCTDNMPWQNREGAARALNIAASVLGL